MIYASPLVFVAVAIWRAGWRKGPEITGITAVICLIFALTFSTNVWDVPCNLWVGLPGILYFPVYAIHHPTQWLNLLSATGIVAAVWLVHYPARNCERRQQLRMRKTPLIRAGMVNFDQFRVCKLGERIHGEDCRYEWRFTAVSSGIDTITTYVRVFLTGSITCGVLVVMELARTCMLCFGSSIYRYTPGVRHGNKD